MPIPIYHSPSNLRPQIPPLQPSQSNSTPCFPPRTPTPLASRLFPFASNLFVTISAGVREARECVVQLDAAQTLLLKVTASGDDDDSTAQAQGVGGGLNPSGTCCGGGGPDHSHSHAHAHAHEPHGKAHGGSGDHAGARCAADRGGGASEGRRGEEEEGAQKEMAGALEVLRQAKAACRIAEAACLLRGGRAAESTETLRNLLFEVL